MSLTYAKEVKRKSNAKVSNKLFEEVKLAFDAGNGELDSPELQNLLNQFTWEMVTRVSPLGGLSIKQDAQLWRLKYNSPEENVMTFKNHIYVKESGLPNAGNGLFADMTFTVGDIISVYVGKIVTGKRRKTTYQMDYSLDRTIDPGKGIKDNECLYLGAHLANDLVHDGEVCDKRKHYNAEFDDIYLMAVSIIQRDKEIYVKYNRK